MSRPRQVFPNQFYMLTRRCTQRQFLLRPDEETTNAFIYCLAAAAKLYDIDVLLTTAMSNHHHTIFFDRHGVFPQFVEHFHKLLARSLNARWRRSENLWAAEEPCVTRLLDRSAVMSKLAYAAANPVKDLLVERATLWPGANGYRALVAGKTLRATRPLFFFRKTMPAELELELVIPAVLGSREQVVDQLRARVEKFERAMKKYRDRMGRRVLGRRAAIEQSWKASPKSEPPRRELRPRFAGRLDARVPALREYRQFLDEHRDALVTWRARGEATFPAGTYWLARFAPVTVHTVTAN